SLNGLFSTSSFFIYLFISFLLILPVFLFLSLLSMCSCDSVCPHTQRYTAFFPVPYNVSIFLHFGHLAFVTLCCFFFFLLVGSCHIIIFPFFFLIFIFI